MMWLCRVNLLTIKVLCLKMGQAWSSHVKPVKDVLHHRNSLRSPGWALFLARGRKATAVTASSPSWMESLPDCTCRRLRASRQASRRVFATKVTSSERTTPRRWVSMGSEDLFVCWRAGDILSEARTSHRPQTDVEPLGISI